MTKYIHSISFVVSDGSVQGVPNMIGVDMNAGSKGKYIYPVVHYTQNRADAVTGWYFVQNDHPPPTHYTKINQDLNQGAGGTYNYLCYTKIGDRKIKHVSFVAFDNGYGAATYNGWQVYGQDLNTGAKRTGKYIYLIYQCETQHDIDALKKRERDAKKAENDRIQRKVNAGKVQQLRIRKQDLQTQKTYIIQHELKGIQSDKKAIDKKINIEERSIRDFVDERYDKLAKLVLLIGNTGHGKSAFGNRLLGDDSAFADKGPYKTSYNNGSCTKKLQKAKANGMSIVDCPGWNDSDGQDRTHVNKLCAFLRGCGGINSFVLITKVGKFDNDFKSKIRYLEYIFGEKFWKHLVIVLTHVDKGMAEAQFERSNKAQQVKDDIKALSKGKNRDVHVIAIGLDNYKEKLDAFARCISREKFVCDEIKSPIDDLKKERERIISVQKGIQRRINDIEKKIKTIDREIAGLAV